MSRPAYWAVIAIVLVGIIAALLWSYSVYSDQCREHGGVHVTYPYKQMPECWDADGRRVFW